MKIHIMHNHALVYFSTTMHCAFSAVHSPFTCLNNLPASPMKRALSHYICRVSSSITFTDGMLLKCSAIELTPRYELLLLVIGLHAFRFILYESVILNRSFSSNEYNEKNWLIWTKLNSTTFLPFERLPLCMLMIW